jgi:hypothetical protein
MLDTCSSRSVLLRLFEKNYKTSILTKFYAKLSIRTRARLTFRFKIQCIFSTENPEIVYSDSGRADFDIDFYAKGRETNGPNSRAQPRNNMGPARPVRNPQRPLSVHPHERMDSDGEEEAAATTAPPAAGRLKGIPELSVYADMREMAKTAAWSVSSCKAGNGVAALRDDNLDTYWQSVRPAAS